MQRLIKPLLIISGTLCVGLGALGLFLPLVPTTPFLLLGAVCYGRSSDRFYQLLLTNRVFGSYIRNYRERRGILLKHKIVAIAVLWISMANAVWFLGSMVWVKIALLSIAGAVTVLLLKIKTLRTE